MTLMLKIRSLRPLIGSGLLQGGSASQGSFPNRISNEGELLESLRTSLLAALLLFAFAFASSPIFVHTGTSF